MIWYQRLYEVWTQMNCFHFDSCFPLKLAEANTLFVMCEIDFVRFLRCVSGKHSWGARCSWPSLRKCNGEYYKKIRQISSSLITMPSWKLYIRYIHHIVTRVVLLVSFQDCVQRVKETPGCCHAAPDCTCHASPPAVSSKILPFPLKSLIICGYEGWCVRSSGPQPGRPRGNVTGILFSSVK